MVANAAQSVITLDPAQQRFFDDRRRIQVVNWHRQKGKDFTAACKAVMHAFETGESWFIVSLTQRQADATFAKCKQIAQAIKKVMKLVVEPTYSERDYIEYDHDLEQYFKCTARELTLPGGGRIVSLPGKDPDTLAGLTGNVILTEFGLFPGGGYDHWRVLFPLITRGFFLIVISTPRGKNTKFHELCSSPEKYSYHFCDIVMSIAEGFILKDQDGNEIGLDEFKDMYGDEAGFQREYMCIFTGDLDALIPLAMLVNAGNHDDDFDLLEIANDSNWNPMFFGCDIPSGCRYEIGWDVARHHDLSAVFVNMQLPNGIRTLRKLLIMRKCSFELQRTTIRTVMDVNGLNVGKGDATGIGEDSNETLTAEYGDRWEGVKFTQQFKSEMGSRMHTMFSSGLQHIPTIHADRYRPIGYDFYAIQKETREDRRLILKETPNPHWKDSHCDVAYAGGLAMMASSMNSVRAGVLHI